jgi:hypothetical protein
VNAPKNPFPDVPEFLPNVVPKNAFVLAFLAADTGRRLFRFVEPEALIYR